MRAPQAQSCEDSSWTHACADSAHPREADTIRPCLRLVVVEDGANDPEDHALPNAVGDTVFIAQGGGERPMHFAQRVIRRISDFEELHRSIVSTIVLLSPRFDSLATAARLALAHKLIAHSAARLGSSELLLSAGSDLHPMLQYKVVSLADLLMAAPAGRTLLVTVQLTSSGHPQVRLILGGSATMPYEDVRLRRDPQLVRSAIVRSATRVRLREALR